MLILSEENIIREAQEVFRIEIEALEKVRSNLDGKFVSAVELILSCQGKVVLSGMGKSGIIAKKIAATLSSTGTLSVFMHPGEGLHGDLGMVDQKDVMIIIGKSGESDEISMMLPVLKKIGCSIISITANLDSTLARNSDVILDASIDREACGLNLAPTSSTTAALVMGDALATILSKAKKFKEENFALFHPAGRLGKRLLYKVSDLMFGIEKVAVSDKDDSFNDVLIKMIDKNLGACLVLDKGELQGIISDGDLKRIFTKYQDYRNLKAHQVMISLPKTIEADVTAYNALLMMQKREKPISVLPVMANGKPVGLLRLHELLEAGL